MTRAIELLVEEPSIEFLVEEPSMEQVLRHLVPRVCGDSVKFTIHVFSGKPDLLKRLPDRLAGYRTWLESANAVVVVIVDRDNDDCVELKTKLNQIAADAGMTVASVKDARPGRVLNRIAIEELEAWFLGDVSAIRAAYRKVPASIGNRARFRDPDGVSGGTAEALGQVLARAGYHQGGLQKIKTAADIAPHLKIEGNRSTSFAHFCSGLRHLVEAHSEGMA